MGLHITNNKNNLGLNINKVTFENWTIYYDQEEGYRFKSTMIDKGILFCYGNIYESTGINLDKIFELIRKSGDSCIYEIDGEFIFGIITQDGCTIYSDREGLIPLYYSNDSENFNATTEVNCLFYNFSEGDIDYSAINDFLRFGMLIGNKTFSNHIKLLEYGSKLQNIGGRISFERIRLAYFLGEESLDEDVLIEELVDKYQKAIRKRLKGDGSETCVFLSGGIDSRFLLACLNEISPQKVKTVSFGQPCSEEAMIALQCAKVKENEFEWQVLTPDKFIESAEEYVKLTCGMDMFPQSYILNVAKQADYRQFYTGFAMGVYLGGHMFNETAAVYEGDLGDFVEKHLKLAKMACVSSDILAQILQVGIRDLFMKWGCGYIREIAAEYEGIPVKNAMQPFVIKNRSVRLVMLRDLCPGRYVNYSNPSVDLEFQKVVKKIPADLRLNHRLYQKLMCEKFEEYANIPYNNTTLPVSFDISLWKEGAKREYERELMYERVMMSDNPDLTNKVYYPHFYSDFNGYSRYDESWRQLFAKYLLDEQLFIYNKLFNYENVLKLYTDHVSGKANWRKEVIAITTLSMFLELFLRHR